MSNGAEYPEPESIPLVVIPLSLGRDAHSTLCVEPSGSIRPRKAGTLFLLFKCLRMGVAKGESNVAEAR